MRKIISLILVTVMVVTAVCDSVGILPAKAKTNALSIGSSVYYGNYIQDKVVNKDELATLESCEFTNNRLNVDGINYALKDDKVYKDTPIEWQILSDEGDCYALISKKVLEIRPFDDHIVETIFWHNSQLREWLNGTFLNDAFSQEEQDDIETTTLSNITSEWGTGDNPYYPEGDPQEVITEDKVYLLTSSDVQNSKYGFEEGTNASELRVAYKTQYLDEEEGANSYWLRESLWSYGVQKGDLVYDDGSLGSWFRTWSYGVRPVIRVKKDAEGLSVTKPVVTPDPTPQPVTSDREEPTGTISKGTDFSLGSTKSGKLNAEVSEFFPANWSVGVSVFPVQLSQKTKSDGSSSVKMAVGVGKSNMLDSKAEWNKYKSAIEDAEKFASLTCLLQRYSGQKRSTFSVSGFKAKPSLSAMGYIEQEYDKYGNLISSTGKIAPELTWKASKNWQFLTPIGPMYSTLAGNVKLAGEIGPKYTLSSKKWDLDGKLNFKPELSLEGGYGINKLATVGVGGKLAGDLQILPKSSLTASASAYVHLYCAFLVDWKHDLKTAKITLWGNDSLLKESDEGWSCSVLDDSFAEHTSEWNTGKSRFSLKKAGAVMGTSDGMTETILQSGILTSSLPIVKEINGTKVMVFQGYDTSRSELNRTVLQYSVCKNGAWTTPKAVKDDGTADLYADMAVVDGKLVLAWQKEKTDVEGDVSDDADAVLNDIAKKSEIWCAVFDETTGSFTEVKRLTDNDQQDIMPKVYEGTDGATITWLRNSSDEYNPTGGTTTIYSQGVGSATPEVLGETTQEIKEYVSYEKDNGNHVAYVTKSADGKTSICNEENEVLVSSTEEEAIAGIQYADLKLLYNVEGKMYFWDDEEQKELLSGESCIPSSAIHCKAGEQEGFAWISNDDETNQGSIQISMKTEDGFSKPVTIYSSEKKRVQYISPILHSDGQWELVANMLNTETGLNELVSVSKTPQIQLSLSGASINEYDVEDNLTAVNYYATNTELTPIEQLIIKITLEDGTEIEKVVDQTIQTGESVSGTTYVDLSDITDRQTVSICVYAKGQTDISNNKVESVVGQSDIRLTNTIEEKGNQAVITATIENVSERTATTTLKLYSDEKNSKQLYQSSPVSIKPWQRYTETITVNKSDLAYNDKNAVYMLLHADASEGDYDESNNDSYAILYRNIPNNSTTNSSGATLGTPNQAKKHSSTNSTVKVAAPAKVKISSAKNKKGRKIALKFKKVSGAKGYQIQYSTKKSFKGKKTKTTSKTSYTIKKLKKKKTYYIRVRAYKLSGKKKVYGTWSKVKKVKVKK